MPEVGFPSGVVRQRRVVHHLQQHVVDILVRLLDLVQQDNAVRVLPNGVDEQSALFETHVAGRRADQSRHGVLLHVLAHVEADELVSELNGQLLGEFRLADAGRSCKQETARGSIRLSEPRARPLDRLRHQMHGLVLPKDDAPERLRERAEPVSV